MAVKPQAESDVGNNQRHIPRESLMALARGRKHKSGESRSANCLIKETMVYSWAGVAFQDQINQQHQ